MHRTGMTTLVMVLATLCVAGCAHQALDKKIDSEVAQENAIKTNADLRSQSNQMLDATKGLSDEKRARLVALRDQTRAQVDEMWSQSLKLRSVLVKDLLSKDYDEDEVELIKQRIRKLEDRRLSVTFDAVDQANQILGHETITNRQRVIDEFFEGHGSRD